MEEEKKEEEEEGENMDDGWCSAPSSMTITGQVASWPSQPLTENASQQRPNNEKNEKWKKATRKRRR